MDPESLHCGSLVLFCCDTSLLSCFPLPQRPTLSKYSTRYLRQHKQSTPKKRRFVQSRTYHGDTPTTLPTVVFPAHPLGTYLAEPPWWHHTFCSQIIHLNHPLPISPRFISCSPRCQSPRTCCCRRCFVPTCPFLARLAKWNQCWSPTPSPPWSLRPTRNGPFRN